MKRSTSKRSRTSVLTRTRAHQQTAVPASLKWVVIAAPGFAFLLLVERLVLRKAEREALSMDTQRVPEPERPSRFQHYAPLWRSLIGLGIALLTALFFYSQVVLMALITPIVAGVSIP